MGKIIELSKEEFFSDNILRRKSEQINFEDPDLSKMIKKLTDAFIINPVSVGLSLPQIGVFKRMAIVNINKNEDANLYLINPEIITFSGKRKAMKESCLSLPNFRGVVKRKDKILLRYHDLNGFLVERQYEGFISRVIQHEIDHLNGILYIDRMENKDDLEEFDYYVNQK